MKTRSANELTMEENRFPSRASVEAIVQMCAAAFDTTSEDIQSGSRVRHVADARAVSMFLTKFQHPEYTNEEIGKMIADQDRTSVNTNIKKVKDLVQSDFDFREKYNSIIRQLEQY